MKILLVDEFIQNKKKSVLKKLEHIEYLIEKINDEESKRELRIGIDTVRIALLVSRKTEGYSKFFKEILCTISIYTMLAEDIINIEQGKSTSVKGNTIHKIEKMINLLK